MYLTTYDEGSGATNESPRVRLLKRHGSMREVFNTWKPALEDLAEHILPFRARWNAADFERGDRINDTIINNTPTVDARICSSGLMAGITSPARRWFKLATPDPELAEFGPVRMWLHMVEERLRWVFGRSNFYQALADGTYPDLTVFGFHASILEENPETVIRAEVLAIGEYFLAANEHGIVDTIHRELQMTVRQVVRRFGLANCSQAIKNLWDRSNYDVPRTIIHCIHPNGEYEPGYADRHGKKFASDWFELGTKEDTFLSRGGYEEFPGLCPRWNVRAGEAYARGPGSEILGDCKALQHLEEKLAVLVDKVVDPPMRASPEMMGKSGSLNPGDVTYTHGSSGRDGFYEPAMEVNPAAIVALERHIERQERHIHRGMFADLWMRVMADDRAQRPTATEIEQGKQETMLQLGPVLERLGPELLKPAIDRTFNILNRMGLLADIPVPEELEGMELKVEFESILHQAQKAVGLGAIRTFVMEVTNLATLMATGAPVLDKINADQVVDEVGDMTGIKPDLIRSDEDVVAMRDARAKQEQAAAQGAAMGEAAKGIAQLGKTPAPSEDNALGAVMSQLGPLAGGLAQA
jgi:hypothetical protein